MKSHQVIVVGAGAAGMMVGGLIAKEGISTLVLEHNSSAGKKILISGGGRCNFTNLHSNPNDFYSNNPHFCKSALANYGPEDFLKLVEDYKIGYFEKKLGQLFCKTSAKKINQMLLDELAKYKAQIEYNIGPLEVKKIEEKFILNDGSYEYSAQKLVVATGGLSIPPIGASDWGYRVAKQFNHKIIPTFPALVPFLHQGFSNLAGISLIAKVRTEKFEVTEDLLFTHKGFSGPAILKASLHWISGAEVIIDFLPSGKILNSNKGELINSLKETFPLRLAEQIITECGFSKSMDIGNMRKEDKLKLEKFVHHYSFVPTGTEGFRKAEVTKGGVDTSDISSKTMESKNEKGLYFIGEVLDVTGQLGGHNFQWAWASAYAASQAILSEF